MHGGAFFITTPGLGPNRSTLAKETRRDRRASRSISAAQARNHHAWSRPGEVADFDASLPPSDL